MMAPTPLATDWLPFAILIGGAVLILIWKEWR
jgi:hypothetical protein